VKIETPEIKLVDKLKPPQKKNANPNQDWDSKGGFDDSDNME